MKNLETLRFADIDFDGTTQHAYNGKMFTATGKMTGFGSGKKTVGTFVVDGTRYENIAIDRLRTILEGTTSTSTRTHRANKVTAGYCFDKLREMFEAVGADVKKLDTLEKYYNLAVEKAEEERKLIAACEVLGITFEQYKSLKK
jgi:hypothetical protein